MRHDKGSSCFLRINKTMRAHAALMVLLCIKIYGGIEMNFELTKIMEYEHQERKKIKESQKVRPLLSASVSFWLAMFKQERESIPEIYDMYTK